MDQNIDNEPEKDKVVLSFFGIDQNQNVSKVLNKPWAFETALISFKTQFNADLQECLSELDNKSLSSVQQSNLDSYVEQLSLFLAAKGQENDRYFIGVFVEDLGTVRIIIDELKKGRLWIDFYYDGKVTSKTFP